MFQIQQYFPMKRFFWFEGKSTISRMANVIKMYDVSPFFVLVHYIVNDIINEIILICRCVYPMAVAYFVNTLIKKG
ncbi:hypothetical protein Bca4012_076000 [Brassica carinata]